MSLPKPQRGELDPALIVPILADGAIASRGVADGRMLPVLILDTSRRPEVAELIRVHRHLPAGDVTSQWNKKARDDDSVFVNLCFLRPMEVQVVLPFSIERQGILVETMLSGHGVYLQPGNPGDRVASTLDAERVLVELSDQGFRPHWDALFLDRMTTVVARRMGIRRRRARPKAEELIAQVRELATVRMRPGPIREVDKPAT